MIIPTVVIHVTRINHILNPAVNAEATGLSKNLISKSKLLNSVSNSVNQNITKQTVLKYK